MTNCGWHISLLRLSAGVDQGYLQELLAGLSRSLTGNFGFRLHPVEWDFPDRFVQFTLAGSAEDRSLELRERLSRAFQPFVVIDNRGRRPRLDVPVRLR